MKTPIQDNLLEISKVFFTNRHNWHLVTDEQKSTYFFIFNRYISKRYPQISQLLNDKMIDKSIGMDLLFYFMKDKPYPKWFWSKSKKLVDDEDSQHILDEIKTIYNLKQQEFNFILENFPSEVDEEINNLQLQKNGNTTKKMVHRKSTKQS